MVHVQEHLQTGQVVRSGVVGRKHFNQLCHTLFDSRPLNLSCGHRLGHVFGAVLEDREHETFSVAEVVLNNSPGHSGPARDLIRA